MRFYIFLISTCILLAFLAGNYALSLRGDERATNSDIYLIENTKKKFKDIHPALLRINFSTFFRSSNQQELLDPFLSKLDGNKSVSSNNFHDKKKCFENISTLINSIKERKVLFWEEYRCGLISELPNQFYATPPFMHPSGFSYAFLSYFYHFPNGTNSNFIMENLSYFHLMELDYLSKKMTTKNIPFSVLKDFKGENELILLITGKENFFTKNYYFSRVNVGISQYDLDYQVYPKESFIEFIKEGPFKVEESNGFKNCFYRSGNICWEYSVAYLLKNSNKSNLGFLGLSLFFIIVLTFILIQKIKGQQQEEDRKRFALRVLTHEFRTPVSSLLLEMERILPKLNILPQDIQESVLRVSDDIFRLQRLTETSRNYLKISQNKKLIHENLQWIPSINEHLRDQIARYDDDFEFIGLKNDQGMNLDPYWLSICIKNIIENSKGHGLPPITATLELEEKKSSYFSKKRKFLKLIISDKGSCEFEHLDQLTTEFVKGKKSSGTGLGLNIVKKVLAEFGGSLTFTSSPTTFTMTIPIIDNPITLKG